LATAIVALEGVLKTEIGAPIPEGIKLYRILAEHYRVIIASDMDPHLTEHWLRSNLIVGYGDIYDNRYFFEGQDLRARQLAIAKAQGKVDLFIDSDADRVAMALANGVTAILFASPKFVRTTREQKSWDEVSSEVERQRLALLDAEQKMHKSGRFE
jgi:hypothetical protein